MRGRAWITARGVTRHPNCGGRNWFLSKNMSSAVQIVISATKPPVKQSSQLNGLMALARSF
jgi:hypothetical protein